MSEQSTPQDDQLLAIVRQEQALRACSRSFLAFLPYWSFVNRETGEVRTFGDLWPGQAAFAQLAMQERFILALKAGKLGFTELGCAYDAWKALFGPPNARVHLFSRDERAAQELLGYVRVGLQQLPEWMRPTLLDGEPGGDTMRSLKFAPGPQDVRVIASFPAGPHVSVDQSCQHAHMDELARMPFPEKTWSTVYSTIAPEGSCHVITRGAGDDNFVAKLWQAAEAGTGVLHPFFQPWTARPDRDRAWYELQEGSLTRLALKFLAPERPEDALAGGDENEFIPIELWDLCREELPPFLPEDREPVVLAVDAAVTGDCFAIVAVTRHPSRHNDIAVRAVKKWDPPRSGRIDFAGPEAFLRAVCRGGCALGHPEPLAGCEACRSGFRHRGYNVVQIAYDPYQLESLMGSLRKEGLSWVHSFPQTTQRLIADSQLHDLIVNRRIAHDGSELLREHVLNAVAEINPKDDSRLRIRKKAPAKKVDLLVALSMASSECLRLRL